MIERLMTQFPFTARALSARAVWLMCLVLGSPTALFAQGQTRTADCAQCHRDQARQFGLSVHHAAVRCQQCHGGDDVYELSDDAGRHVAQPPSPLTGGSLSRASAVSHHASTNAPTTTTSPSPFDHGNSFKGKPARAGVPQLCGSCHSDVERMNPYGLRTDQLASYWVSGHGKRLKQNADDRVAVCTDCHGVHNVLHSSSPQSRTHFRNIPQTCARCHADRGLMQAYNLSADIPEQYGKSVHGKNLLEKDDAGSPHCATCHGNHAAAPPGYLEVGHVCGKCHKQIEEYFLASVHGKIPVMARCIGCHAKEGERWNHQIEEASPPVDLLVESFVKVRAEVGDNPETLRERFFEEVDVLSGSMRFNTVCTNCHAPGRQGPHASFFAQSDQRARDCGQELATALRQAQYDYAQASERVARLGRGVLLLRDEALRVEDAKTELQALYAFVHSLNRPEIQARVEGAKKICRDVNTGLDQKERSLLLRRAVLLPVWGFILLFSVLMYRKYMALKHAYVLTPQAASAPRAADLPFSTGRRRLLDAALGALGSISLVALLWPAVAFVLPARKRGGGGERVSAGKAEEWMVWDARKLSVRGKPAVVIRTESGYRAFSAVCTHLGCIVRWNATGRDFDCPCHAAKFDAAGQVISGPPPKPLPQLGVSVVQGEVMVSDS